MGDFTGASLKSMATTSRFINNIVSSFFTKLPSMATALSNFPGTCGYTFICGSPSAMPWMTTDSSISLDAAAVEDTFIIFSWTFADDWSILWTIQYPAIAKNVIRAAIAHFFTFSIFIYPPLPPSSTHGIFSYFSNLFVSICFVLFTNSTAIFFSAIFSFDRYFSI